MVEVSESGLVKIRLETEEVPPEVPKKREIKAQEKNSPVPNREMTLAERIELAKKKDAEKQKEILAALTGGKLMSNQ